MLTINCTDKQIQLTEQECSYSIFLSNLLKYNETTLNIPFESKTINIYFSFLRNLFSKVDFGGEFTELLTYFSEPKTIDNFIDDYINTIEPQNMMDITEFYGKFNAYVGKNNDLKYLCPNAVIPYSTKQLHWVEDDAGQVYLEKDQILIYDYKSLKQNFYNRTKVQVLHIIIPNITNIIKNEFGKDLHSDLYDNTEVLLKSMLKFYFYNKSRKFDN